MAETELHSSITEGRKEVREPLIELRLGELPGTLKGTRVPAWIRFKSVQGFVDSEFFHQLSSIAFCTSGYIR